MPIKKIDREKLRGKTDEDTIKKPHFQFGILSKGLGVKWVYFPSAPSERMFLSKDLSLSFDSTLHSDSDCKPALRHGESLLLLR